MSEIGDFQQDVGQFSSKINLIGSYFFLIITIVISIIIFSVAMKKRDCTEQEKKLQNNKSCGKRKLWLLLIIPPLITLGLFSVWYSRFYDNLVQQNKSVAMVEGTMYEANLIKDLFE